MNGNMARAEMDVILDAYHCGYADSGQPQGLILAVKPTDSLHCDNCIYWRMWLVTRTHGECLLQFEKNSPISLSIQCRHSDHDDAAIITKARYGCVRGIARKEGN